MAAAAQRDQAGQVVGAAEVFDGPAGVDAGVADVECLGGVDAVDLHGCADVVGDDGIVRRSAQSTGVGNTDGTAIEGDHACIVGGVIHANIQNAVVAFAEGNGIGRAAVEGRGERGDIGGAGSGRAELRHVDDATGRGRIDLVGEAARAVGVQLQA